MKNNKRFSESNKTVIFDRIELIVYTLIIGIVSAMVICFVPLRSASIYAPDTTRTPPAEIPAAYILRSDEYGAVSSSAPRINTVDYCYLSNMPTVSLLGRYYITGYDACIACCGKTDGITRSGAVATVGKTVAMCGDGKGFYINGTRYPFGTRIYIKGLGVYTVQDTGVGPGCVDVFCQDHAACYAITEHYDVYLIID
jgi:3D (Asp-Asp-Asp) domain-containing protein